MDAASMWTLTANSYLSSITNSAGISGTAVTNITGNGFNVYYNSSLSANSYLGGKIYTLVNGGYLLPAGTTAVNESVSDNLSSYTLAQNYPNPFNPTTTFSFNVPYSSFVTLKIYDVKGGEVASIVNQNLTAGTHYYTWNASGLASGIYYYKITAVGSAESNAKSFTQVKKLILLK
jgi:hypothetical protein